jgi:hypothetical protein
MITKLKKFFEKHHKADSVDLTERNKNPTDKQQVPNENTFLRDFTEKLREEELSRNQAIPEKPLQLNSESSIHSPVESPVQEKQGTMKMTPENKQLLKSSITISLDFPVERKDLRFVANSRIDGKPIYIYTGDDFSTFDLPYEEMVSLEDFTNSSQLTNYVEYVAEQLSTTINQNQRSYQDLLTRKEEMKGKWMQKYGNLHNFDK